PPEIATKPARPSQQTRREVSRSTWVRSFQFSSALRQYTRGLRCNPPALRLSKAQLTHSVCSDLQTPPCRLKALSSSAIRKQSLQIACHQSKAGLLLSRLVFTKTKSNLRSTVK